MTKILTVRMDPHLLSEAEARASRLGLDRAKYIRKLIQEDLSHADDRSGKRFASEDLAGMYEGETTPATNDVVRSRLRNRSQANH